MSSSSKLPSTQAPSFPADICHNLTINDSIDDSFFPLRSVPIKYPEGCTDWRTGGQGGRREVKYTVYDITVRTGSVRECVGMRASGLIDLWGAGI